MNNNFRIDIIIVGNCVDGKIYDLSLNEEYTNFRVQNITGDFIGKIRDEYIDLLNDIKNKCTEPQLFLFEQSNRISKLIKEKYNCDPNFEWKKFPGYASFKNQRTNKWYGIIMNVDKSKLDKSLSGEVEIIDIKLAPEKIEHLLNKEGFYPAYHMNKKNWISIILNGTIKDNYLMELIGESYLYSNSK